MKIMFSLCYHIRGRLTGRFSLLKAFTMADTNMSVMSAGIVGMTRQDIHRDHVNGENNNNKTGVSDEIDQQAYEYEEAVMALQGLMSNAEVIAENRKKKKERLPLQIPKMWKNIEISGLTEEDVNRLSVIHVSGTKGKGSTCAFCERILHCKGYKTGLFSSPHLIEVRERIRINGRPISKSLFCQQFWKVYNRLTDAQRTTGHPLPGYFAFLTILSLHVFIHEKVDVAVMEVGIGGQYDSTNIFKKPAVCGTTSLALEHTGILGNTIEEIAWNKAGIFKKGVPAVTVPQTPAALGVMLSRAKEIENPLYVAQPLDLDVLEAKNITLGISGNKQCLNASLAVNLADIWEKRLSGVAERADMQHCTFVKEIPKLEVSDFDEAVSLGLSKCVWPGRAQTVHQNGVTYYLDGAHTPESIEVCADWFKQAANREKSSLGTNVAQVLVFNVTGERDVEPLLNILKMCKFDAAVFCTNLGSTVAAENKTDQLKKDFVLSADERKVQENKACWDQLMAAMNKTQAEDTEASRKVMTHTDVKDSSVHITNDDDPSTSSSKRLCIKNNNGQFVESGHANGVDYDHEIGRKSKTLSNVSEINGLGEKVSPKTKHVSHSFSCIRQALNWATQARDPKVMVKDPDVILPDFPPVLKEADHIQVLATGSLYLVGGILGIITPDMND